MSAKTQKICCCFLVDMLWHLEVSLTLRYAKLCCIVKTDPPIWLTFAILPISFCSYRYLFLCPSYDQRETQQTNSNTNVRYSRTQINYYKCVSVTFTQIRRENPSTLGKLLAGNEVRVNELFLIQKTSNAFFFFFFDIYCICFPFCRERVQWKHIGFRATRTTTAKQIYPLIIEVLLKAVHSGLRSSQELIKSSNILYKHTFQLNFCSTVSK